jgi:tellurite methyltransferase
MEQPFWEQTYADLNATTFGEPSEEIRKLVHLLPPRAKVLDLGCGEGRNALFLAQAGFDVTVVDISEAGIRKLRFVAERENLALVRP